jgi:hypothetical protein
VAPLKPVWTSATFFFYAGTVIVVVSLIWLLSELEDEHGIWGLVGWAALALVVSAATAVYVEQRGETLVAGLVAVVAIVSWAVFVGSFLDAIGLLDAEGGDFFRKGLALDFILLEVLVIVACTVALRRFRHPFIVLPLAAVVWYAVMDLLEGIFGGGNTATAILAVLAGLVYLLVAVTMDGDGKHPYAFWLHVVAGLSVGGGVLWFWHEHDWEWLLVIVVALVYVLAARGLDRSSYAVLGAVGLFAAATHFIDKWFSLESLIPFFFDETPADVDEWGRPLLYLALGCAFVAIGLFVQRRRAALPPPPPETGGVATAP